MPKKSAMIKKWEERTRNFLRQFVMHDSVAHSRADGEVGDCEGCDADMDAVIAHVASQRKIAAREREEEILALLDVLEKDIDPKTSEGDEGYMQAIFEVRAAITKDSPNRE